MGLSLAILFLGIGFLWFGLSRVTPVQPTPSPVPVVESSKPVASSSATEDLEGERVKVTKVVDGDTIVVDDKITVRLIGIDTPETVDPRRPVGCFGKEASNKAKELLSGKQ